jgi:hypothetical protein
MRKLALLAIAAASLASGAAMAQSASDAVPYWTGCVIARQFTANGASIAIDRVCSKTNHTVSVFEPYQLGQRPFGAEYASPTALHKAEIRFTGLRSRYAQGDSRQASLWLEESGPNNTMAQYKYDIELSVDQEAIVTMPSGISIGLRMDTANVPTPFKSSLMMPSWPRQPQQQRPPIFSDIEDGQGRY